MSLPTSQNLEKRHDLRLDSVFSVLLETEFGEFVAVARNVSPGGMFIETRDPLPLASKVIVRFQIADSDDEIVARGEVKNHYFLNFQDSSLTGMGLRFFAFEAEGRAVLQRHLYRTRVLH